MPLNTGPAFSQRSARFALVQKGSGSTSTQTAKTRAAAPAALVAAESVFKMFGV